jgi:hypothetical protein
MSGLDFYSACHKMSYRSQKLQADEDEMEGKI